MRLSWCLSIWCMFLLSMGVCDALPISLSRLYGRGIPLLHELQLSQEICSLDYASCSPNASSPHINQDAHHLKSPLIFFSYALECVSFSRELPTFYMQPRFILEAMILPLLMKTLPKTRFLFPTFNPKSTLLQILLYIYKSHVAMDFSSRALSKPWVFINPSQTVSSSPKNPLNIHIFLTKTNP